MEGYEIDLLKEDHAGPTFGVKPILQNVVATMNVGEALDLKNIAMRARNASYNPKRFSAVIMRIKNPYTTALMFRTGKVVVTGAKSLAASKRACRIFVKILRKVRKDTDTDTEKIALTEYKVQNMVASFDAGFRVKLERLQAVHANWARYEPELFPGLIYHFQDRNEKILIFHTGKAVITGAKDSESIQMIFNLIFPVMMTFRAPRMDYEVKSPRSVKSRKKRKRKKKNVVDDDINTNTMASPEKNHRVSQAQKTNTRQPRVPAVDKPPRRPIKPKLPDSTRDQVVSAAIDINVGTNNNNNMPPKAQTVKPEKSIRKEPKKPRKRRKRVRAIAD